MIHISFDKEKGKKEEKKKDTEISQQVDITGEGGGRIFLRRRRRRDRSYLNVLMLE